MVALLIEFGADVSLTNGEGVTALGLAAAQGHCDVVRLLVQAGASLTAKDNQSSTPMVQAAASGHLNVVGYLLSCDWPGTPDLLKNQSHQALVAAASNGHINVSDGWFYSRCAKLKCTTPLMFELVCLSKMELTSLLIASVNVKLSS